MAALARIHPDARSDYLTVFPDARCRREPLLRKPRELAQARKLGLIGESPAETRTDLAGRWNLVGPFALQLAFWAVVIATLIHIGGGHL